MIATENKVKPTLSDSTKSSMGNLVAKFNPAKMSDGMIGAKTLSTPSLIPTLAGERTLPQSVEKNSKIGNVDTDFYTNASSGMKKDNPTSIVLKTVSFLQKIEEDRTTKKEINKNFEEESLKEEQRYYEDILKSMKESLGVETKEEKQKTEEKSNINIPDIPGSGGASGKKGSPTSKRVPGGKPSKLKTAAIVGGGIAAGAAAVSTINTSGPEGTPPAPTATQEPSNKPSNVPMPVSRQALKEKIGGAETGNGDAAYNTMNLGTGESKSNVITAGNKDVKNKPYKKNLTDMTIGEVIDLANKRSSHFKKSGMGAAAGKYQFMPVALEDRGPKALGANWKKEKFTPENQEKLMDSLIDKNAKSLENAGVPVSAAGLYLVHLLGNGQAAARVLKADDNAKMSDLIGAAASNANPRIAALTVGDYKGQLNKKGLDSQAIDLNASTATNVSSGFGERIDPQTGKKAAHLGIDYAAPQGTPVNVTSAGKVVSAGMTDGGYGNLVVVDHGNGVVTRYAHLSTVDVKIGDTVQAGQKVGGVGTTGKSTGNHLHYEILKDGKQVDPAKNALSLVSPVGGSATNVAEQKQTGERVSSISTDNKELKGNGKQTVVAMTDNSSTIINTPNNSGLETVITASKKDLPLFLTPTYPQRA